MMRRWLLALAVLSATGGVTQVAQGDLTNGGFEAGSLAGWTLAGSAGMNGGVQTSVPVVGVKEGRYSGRISFTTSPVVGAYTTLSQTLDLNAGDTLEGWYSLRNSSTFYTYPAYAKVIGSDGEDVIWTETILRAASYLAAYVKPWTEWEWEAPESGTYTLQFGLNNPSGRYGGVVYLDDMTLTAAPPEPVPLPGAVVLLTTGLCTVGALRRRLQDRPALAS